VVVLYSAGEGRTRLQPMPPGLVVGAEPARNWPQRCNADQAGGKGLDGHEPAGIAVHCCINKDPSLRIDSDRATTHSSSRTNQDRLLKYGQISAAVRLRFRSAGGLKRTSFFPAAAVP
jgi:hypothetical protein